MKNIIIGAGPAGRLAGLELGSLGEEALLIEKKHIAGTCLNEGCMVICALTDIARFLNNKKRYERLGLIKGDIDFSYEEIVKKISKTQEILRKINQEENEAVNNEIIYGEAKLEETQVIVNGKSYEYENLLIATGGRPFIPDIPGNHYGLTNQDILKIKKVPEKLNIIGGGIIAAEISNIFSSFGSEVTILSRSTFLKELDVDMKEYVINKLLKNVKIYENTNVSEIKSNKTIFKHLPHEKDIELEGKTFIATGRIPNSEIAKNADNLDIKLDKSKNKTIKVNKLLQTKHPNIYAAGEVIGGLNLTPVARMEGITAARNMAGYLNEIEYNTIPQSLTLDMDLSFASKEKRTNNIENSGNFRNSEDSENIEIKVPGSAGPDGFWRVLEKDTGITKMSFNKKTSLVETVIAVSPSSVSDVAYLSYLMRTGENLKNYDEFMEIHPSTDMFYKIMKHI